MAEQPLWEPGPERIEKANLTRFARQAIQRVCRIIVRPWRPRTRLEQLVGLPYSHGSEAAKLLGQIHERALRNLSSADLHLLRASRQTLDVDVREHVGGTQLHFFTFARERVDVDVR